MAVAPTGAIYKALEFDGVSSRTYGVYITGEAVYNAPERDVEMVTIPGRNGTYALDNGRFENIEVSYPAGIFAETEADFRQAISEFRNFLCSRKGYVRLQDEYNPDEYRLAVYKSGLEVEPAMLKAGEFDIVFDCKPQRFLTSGETAITIGEWRDTETVSGDIVEVENPDGILGVKSLSVALSPIQDLHGYDKPWVGGNGRNKLPPFSSFTENGITATVDSNGIITLNGTATENIAKQVVVNAPADDYCFSLNNTATVGTNSSNTIYFYAIDSGGSWVANPMCYHQNAVGRGTSQNGIAVVRMVILSGVTVNNFVIKPQLEQGSTATSYAPYENICPISGHTEVDVVVSPTTDAEDGNTYTTALGRTVYGGTLDVVSGVLTVDRAMLTLNTANMNNIEAFPGWKDSGIRALVGADISKAVTNATMNIGTIYAINTHSSNDILFLSTNQYGKTQGEWRALAIDVQAIIELATPQTYQLSPQEVALLTGTNNVWSDSGDITLEYGQLPNLLINPTLFEASPLLAVEGYGNISFNGFSIALDLAYIGDVTLLGSSSGQSGVSGSYSSAMMLANDTITLSGTTFKWRATATAGQASQMVSASLSLTSQQTTGTPTVSYSAVGTNALDITVKYPQQTFTEGSNTTLTDEGNLVVTYKDSSNVSHTVSLPIRIGIKVDTSNAANSHMSVTNYGRTQPSGWRLQAQSVSISSLTGYSTQSVLGNPTYVDCELGEAYKYVDGTPVSLNKYIDLGSILPIFASGSNEITFDNTVTDLKITPNWWKI